MLIDKEEQLAAVALAFAFAFAVAVAVAVAPPRTGGSGQVHKDRDVTKGMRKKGFLCVRPPRSG